MPRVTLNVLFMRYVYMMRQRWGLTLTYLLVPLCCCLYVFASYNDPKLVKYTSPIEEHDEKSLLVLNIPEGVCDNSASEEDEDDCLMKILVSPDGPEERRLMDNVVSALKQQDGSPALDVAYVDDAEQMEGMLVAPESVYLGGLHFVKISSTGLEYKMRPPVHDYPSLLYDWGDYSTTKRFPSPMHRGPRLTDPYFDIDEKLPSGSIKIPGLLPVQVAVDKAYVTMHFPNNTATWNLVSFPHPAYFELPWKFRFALSHRFYLVFTQLMIMMGIITMISALALYTITDKMSGVREWMCLNGAVRWMVNSSWLISFCFEAAVLSFLEMAILKIPTDNGPTVTYMSATVLFFVLVVYNWHSLCWVYLFAALLQSQILCVLLMVAYWILSLLFNWIPPDGFALQGFLAALPNAGLVLVFKSFQEFDGAETVLDLNRLYTHPIHFLPVGILLLIMLMSSVVAVLLGFYVDIVSPGPYGRAKPWYLFEKKENLQGDPADNGSNPADEKNFEEMSSDEPIALECVGISISFRIKKFPWCSFHKAVRNVNMQIPESKITVLLGPNGAGKTSLFSMMCGMHSPSAGHFYTKEYDVFHGDNMKKFRKALGYCPQHNLLMKSLTVKQHLILFGLLKGLSRSEAEGSCDDWLAKFNMEEFEGTKVEKLSGGTKRKLCLAISLTGDPLYLLLDEPSAGLDVQSRRDFWNTLLEQKSYCTVLLTTHDMDEAEILGDRVAFLMNGELVGYGSSSFMKKQLEAGYKLNCTVDDKDRENFLKSVLNFEPSISVLYQTQNLVSLGVPLNKAKVVPNLLKSVESEFKGSISISISSVALEDVFVKFLERPKSGKGQNHVDNLKLKENDIDRPSGCGQVSEIFRKKGLWFCNQSLPTAFIFLLLFPIVGILSSAFFTANMSYESSSVADLKLTVDAYSGKTAFISKSEGGMSDALKRSLEKGGIRYEEVTDYMLDVLDSLAKEDLFKYRSEVVFAFDIGENSVSTAYYSRNAFHTAPIAYSALINAQLEGRSSIITHNYPFVKSELDEGCLGMIPEIIAIVFELLLGPMLLLAGSYFVIHPHLERRTLFKHLQLTTGLLPWTYWISHFIFDMLLFSISVLFLILISAAVDFGLDETALLAFMITLLLYGAAIIAFAYVCSFCKCSAAIIIIRFITIPPLLLLGVLIMSVLLPFQQYTHLVKYLYFLPWVILMESLRKIGMWGALTKSCNQCGDPTSCAMINTQSLFGTLKGDLICFVIVTLFCFIFIVAMDHGFGRKLKPMYAQMCYGPIKLNDDVNPQVAEEKQRVRYLDLDSGGGDQPGLICDGLGKKFSSDVVAVREVTFAHDRGLFGLLGVNGSGKSTTLGMLSGVISPSSGSAIIKGQWDLTDCEHKYIRNIGFCPQSGGLLPGLSGRSTMRLFAHLRGVKPSKRNAHIKGWLEALDMVSLADRPSEQYSIGNQRKLSLAIAMIGYPSVVLLDEPTASIDTVVRRRIWDILGRKDSDQAVVLTSHTMSECETICDRITVMVHGEMKCLGSIPELKKNFSKSSTLQVKLQQNATPKQVEDVEQRILRRSQLSRYAELQEKQVNQLSFNVKLDKIKIQDVFTEMLKIKDDNSVIENFSLVGTPIEEIFMKYAPPKKRTRRKK